MEHMYFEVQLYINISNFKEISNIDILINLCLGTTVMRILKRNKKVSTRIQVDACRPSTRIRVDACRPSATLFPKLPCSLVFGHFPKMVSSLNVPGSL